MVGCCGWPMGRTKYYEHFPLVELQSTFYEPPSLALARKWRENAPADFIFCLKAWHVITHPASSPTYRKLKSKLSLGELEEFGFFRPTEQVMLGWERTREIASALRARVVLFQCPRSFLPTRENIRNLTRFFEEIGEQPWNLAWEPRGDWPADIVRDICKSFGIIHCVDPFSGQSTTPDRTYWRLHGRGKYRHKYSDDELRELRGMVNEVSGGEPYVFFNNVYMREDALRFLELMREAA